ncbi:MAG: hypothetical protein SWQ30_19785 [Thermodesulfobacteriota bacterium]|nr:hypothetical protein [Thermodesulfobacteriota bacterium]
MNTDKRAWHKNQVEQYVKEQAIYEQYANTLSEVLKRACRKHAPLAIVEVRAKGLSSFAEKAMRKAEKYKDPVRQLTDLCGARVITQTQSEVENICQFIRENEETFEIDEANSEDKLKEMGPSQFGYLSVHYVVQMKPGMILGVTIPDEIGPRKAEIQVRTLLQHAWASISHDRLYKSHFSVPAKWERDAARLSAILEETDQDFARFVKGLEMYACHYGAYMTKEQMDGEMETLHVILENDPDVRQKEVTALRIARIAKAGADWQKVIDVLKDFENTDNPAILRELGNALCRKGRKETAGNDFRSGHGFLEKALQLDDSNAWTHAAIARSWEVQEKEQEAREHYSQAFQLDTSNPYYLSSFLEYEVFCQRDFAGLGLLRPTLRSGIERCRAHADVQIELPKAFFTMGRFHCLLGEPYEGLGSYAKGIQLCTTEGAGVPEELLDAELNACKRFRAIRESIKGYEWLRCLLLLGKSVKSPDGKLVDDAMQLAFEGVQNPGSMKNMYKEAPSVLIVAGSCDESAAEDMDKYQELLLNALGRFRGVIISGGTTAGISGMVGHLSEKARGEGEKEFQSVGYTPRLTPGHVTLDRERYDHLLETDGADFSALEPIQMWIDLLASGVKPSEVKLLGIGGGEIAAFEYRLALALGGSVAILAGAVGATSDLEEDRDWSNAENLACLPFDATTIRAFANTPVHTPRYNVDPEKLAQAAKAKHEKKREERLKKMVPDDPSLKPWPELPEPLKESNRQQVLYYPELLRAVGYGLRPAGKEKTEPLEFSSEEVEIMAEMEHGRFNAERLKGGWKLGPRDADKKTSPYLVPWSELDKVDDEIKEYDRDIVRAIPEVLEDGGLEVYKL